MASLENEQPNKAEEARQYGSIKQRWLFRALGLVATVIVLTVALTCYSTAEYYYTSMRTNLANRAISTSQFMSLFLNRNYDDFYENSAKLVNDFEEWDKLEIQIVDSTGRVMFSSSGISAGFIPSTLDIEQALAGESPAVWQGINQVTGERVMSASAPLYYFNGQVIGAVRFTTSLIKVDARVRVVWLAVFLVGAVVFLLVLFTNLYFIRSIVRPILRLNDLTRTIAAGSYGVKIENTSDDEIGELCDSINYMSEQIMRSEKLKNDFLSSVSHELRTPLTAIGGWSETLMASGMHDSDLAQKGLDIIHSESHRLEQMVEELLDYSRLESGRLRLSSELFDLRGVFADAAYIYNDMLTRAGIAVRYDEPEEPVRVIGDGNRLKQVFLNIIDNAAKYGGAGGVVEFSLFSEGGMAVASIRDFGQGIAPGDLPAVKEKFYRGASQTQKRGTGIGLSVSNEIIKLHGGTLDIESRQGEGTRVVIRLPLCGKQAAPEQ